MAGALTFGQVAVDAQDAQQLAGFYAALFDQPLEEGASSHWARLAGQDGRPSIMFLKVEEERLGKNRLHLDFFTTDTAHWVDRALQAGATHLGEFDEHGATWTTLADPEGNVFDIGLAHD